MLTPRSILAFAQGAILGYALLRLWSWWGGEPDPRLIRASEHIPFFWRVATALWWGSLAAVAAWRFPTSERWLERTLVPVVLVAVAVAVGVP